MERKSFLKYLMENFFGFSGMYEEIKKSKTIKILVFAYTAVLLILFFLSCITYNGVVRFFISLLYGFSLLFIGYVLSVIVLCDRPIKIGTSHEYSYCYNEDKEYKKTRQYKRTKIFGIILIILGIVLVFKTNSYRNHYKFLCGTFYIYPKENAYHIYEDCDETLEPYEIRGFEIEKRYPNMKLCPYCEEVEAEGSRGKQ